MSSVLFRLSLMARSHLSPSSVLARRADELLQELWPHQWCRALHNLVGTMINHSGGVPGTSARTASRTDIINERGESNSCRPENYQKSSPFQWSRECWQSVLHDENYYGNTIIVISSCNANKKFNSAAFIQRNEHHHAEQQTERTEAFLSNTQWCIKASMPSQYEL